jgi:hypothetical protein
MLKGVMLCVKLFIVIMSVALLNVVRLSVIIMRREASFSFTNTLAYFLGATTFSIPTLITKGLFVKLSIKDIQHK